MCLLTGQLGKLPSDWVAETRFPTENIITNMYFYFLVTMFLVAAVLVHVTFALRFPALVNRGAARFEK